MAKRKGGVRKTPRGGKKARTQEQDASDAEKELAAAAIEQAVDRDLRELEFAQDGQQRRSAEEPDAQVGEQPGEQSDDDEAEEDEAQANEAGEESKPDPYLMADASYIQTDTRWRNKQRTLVFASRGVTSRFRHLMEDLRKLLPHHKTEPKFEKEQSLSMINEVCELKSCNNVIYFEARKKEHLFMYLGRVPSGPTIKFQVLNIHTTAEVRLAGNCLLGSRPLLYFDKPFSELAELQLMRSMLTQAFGTPRNHPKSKPFHDHVMAFYWMDGKVWFRHYQVAPETPVSHDDPEHQELTEIGPRFVLDPIRILSGSFHGQTLYKNPQYMSPTELRVHAKQLLRSPYAQKLKDKADRKARVEAGVLPEDPTEDTFL